MRDYASVISSPAGRQHQDERCSAGGRRRANDDDGVFQGLGASVECAEEVIVISAHFLTRYRLSVSTALSSADSAHFQ